MNLELTGSSTVSMILLSGIPDEVPIVGGLHIGNVDVPRVHLPKLASGTRWFRRAHGEFAAIPGDNKRETEVVSR
ncbi:MAG: hypothetical protein ACLUAR_20135 [Pilosibacter sp.]